MNSFITIVVLVGALNSHAATIKSVECDKIQSLFRTGTIDSDYGFDELLKIDFEKSIFQWDDGDFKAFKDLAMKCRHPNSDESYFAGGVDDSIKWIKETLPKKMAEMEKRDKASSGIKELSSRATVLMKNIDDEKVKQLQDILVSLKALNLPPTDTDGLLLSAEINNKLAEFGEKKNMDKIQAEEVARQARLASMDKKQRKEAEATAQKERQTDASAFKKCEKVKGELQGHLNTVAQLKKKYGSSVSEKMQKEGVRKMESELYEIDKLSPKIDELGCQRFYAH